MCIRDRVSTQSTWGNDKSIKKTRRKMNSSGQVGEAGDVFHGAILPDTVSVDDWTGLGLHLLPNHKIRSINVFHDSQMVYGLEVFYADPSRPFDMTTGKRIGNKASGATQQTSATFEHDEYLVEVGGEFSSYFNQLYFLSSKNNKTRVGGSGGLPFVHQAPPGTHFSGINFGIGGFLHNISLKISPLPQPGQATISTFMGLNVDYGPLPVHFGYSTLPNLNQPATLNLNLLPLPEGYEAPAPEGQQEVDVGDFILQAPQGAPEPFGVIQHAIVEQQIGPVVSPFESLPIKNPALTRSAVVGSRDVTSKYFDNYQEVLAKKTANPEIASIKVYYNINFILGIEVTYRDNESSFGPFKHIGTNGIFNPFFETLTLEPGEYITEFSGTASDKLDHIVIKTSNGKTLNQGGIGGAYFELLPKDEIPKKIAGIGGSTSYALQSLYIYY
eukprot:TRINITY_DN412_c0_g1_i3.p1 TRINITY_DN412_c0_g1~~TRINITY_DN412_c0_g1_i3.p1  ORF type:complete len:443 (-),score=99.24 TRINITY_DN412_c0_g1_i3:99-1427(-)